ncbi:MAG: hypothetical protein WD749_08690 [Phycisphaerales bacterium]
MRASDLVGPSSPTRCIRSGTNLKHEPAYTNSTEEQDFLVVFCGPAFPRDWKGEYIHRVVAKSQRAVGTVVVAETDGYLSHERVALEFASLKSEEHPGVALEHQLVARAPRPAIGMQIARLNPQVLAHTQLTQLLRR